MAIDILARGMVISMLGPDGKIALDKLPAVSGGGAIGVESTTMLPDVGDPNAIYFIYDDQSILRWDAKTQKYMTYGGGGESVDIELIYGGNAK